MTELPKELLINPAHEDDEEPTPLESFQLSEIVSQTDESAHSSHDYCNRYEVLNTGKAASAQGSSRALFALVIIVCLISLLSLLLTLLILVGKIGSSNEGSYLAKIKALEENITSLQLGLFQQCATPCYSANNSVYGKEGMKGEKGEKGEKGDSGTNCKHSSQDPNKPSAHIEGTNHGAGVNYEANTVIKDWNVSAPSSHLAGGMKYHDGNLTVPTPGRYYIYTQLYYHSTGRVIVCVNSNCVTMIQPLRSGTGHGALYAGGVFNLKAGDVILLKTRWKITIYMSSSFHSYISAFLI